MLKMFILINVRTSELRVKFIQHFSGQIGMENIFFLGNIAQYNTKTYHKCNLPSPAFGKFNLLFDL